MLTRRSFLGGMSATAWTALYGGSPSEGVPRLRLGVMSDVHVFHPNDECLARFKLALEWCRKMDVDGVLIAGDLTEEGYADQLALAADQYFSVFRDDKGRDGRDVARLIVTGNHDIGEFWMYRLAKKDAATIDACRKRSLVFDSDRVWRNCWNEPWQPIFKKTVKGVPFVGAHWTCWNDQKLAAFFAENPLPDTAPFFYAQHNHPLDTVYGHVPGESDDGSSTRFFSTRPNALVFSGHSHRPVRDARAIWQGGFTSVATGSVCQTFVPNGSENSSFAPGHKGPAHMPMFNGLAGATVLLADLYDDRLVIRRQNVIYDERIADDWVVSLPVGTAQWSFEPRQRRARPPAFPKGAVAVASVCDGQLRFGPVETQVVVKFPRAQSAGRDTVTLQYRVRAVAKGKEILVRTVFAERHYLCEERLLQSVREESCAFGADEIPSGTVFYVSPLDEWGQAGPEIQSSPVA